MMDVDRTGMLATFARLEMLRETSRSRQMVEGQACCHSTHDMDDSGAAVEGGGPRMSNVTRAVIGRK